MGFRSWFLAPVTERIDQMADQITAALKASLDSYIADVQKLVDQAKADTATAIAKAVADDRAGRDVDLVALQAEVEAAHAKIVIPPFQPSNQ